MLLKITGKVLLDRNTQSALFIVYTVTDMFTDTITVTVTASS